MTATTATPFEIISHSVGAWALNYLGNADPSDISDEEQAMADSWLERATDDWRDSDDNLWVFAHKSLDIDSLNEFGLDEITALRGPVYTVQMIFRKGN